MGQVGLGGEANLHGVMVQGGKVQVDGTRWRSQRAVVIVVKTEQVDGTRWRSQGAVIIVLFTAGGGLTALFQARWCQASPCVMQLGGTGT